MIWIAKKRLSRQVSMMVLASLFCFVTELPANAQTERNPDPTVSQQLEKLAAALHATQQQVEQSQKQIQQMQAEIDRLRALLAAKEALPELNATTAEPTASAAATESPRARLRDIGRPRHTQVRIGPAATDQSRKLVEISGASDGLAALQLLR